MPKKPKTFKPKITHLYECPLNNAIINGMKYSKQKIKKIKPINGSSELLEVEAKFVNF